MLGICKSASIGLNLSLSTSKSIFLFVDKLIQNFGFYNTIVHVLGELGQNIEVAPSLYMEEFKNHKFTSFKKSIKSEIIEAINHD